MGQETLVFRRAGFSPALSLLMSAFALLIPPPDFTVQLQRLTERSPTQRASHNLLNSYLSNTALDCLGKLYRRVLRTSTLIK